MPQAIAQFRGVNIVWARICFPQAGVWVADLRLEKKVELPTTVTFTVHDLSLTGTILRSASGAFLDQSSVKVVGGKNGWKTKLPPTHFRGGGLPGFVTTKVLLDDVQRLTGETINVQSGVLRPDIGYPDFIRVEAPAHRSILTLIESAAVQTPEPLWWVQDDGTVLIGYRTTYDAAKNTYDVISYDPSTGLIEIATDKINQVRIGARVQTPDNQTLTVRELQVNFLPGKTRVLCWV